MDVRRYIVTKKEDIKGLSVKPRLKGIEPNVNVIYSIIGPRRAGKTFFIPFNK